MKGSGVGEVSKSFVPTLPLSHAEEQAGFPYSYAVTFRAQYMHKRVHIPPPRSRQETVNSSHTRT